MKHTKTALAVLAGLQLASHSVFAQQQETPNAEAEKDVEVIQVTGSNIRGVDLEGSQPLTIISEEDIKRSGAATVADLMQLVNQTRGGVGTFNTAQSGATSTSTPPGQAAASLRGLGPSATLTLINGRRVAASSFASGTENFVDINSIPASAIKRVDVLASGASAIYGADAVAGVINYILKDSYEGFALTGAYENTTDNDNHGRINLQGLWGTEVAGGDLVAYFDYFDRQEVRATDFSQTRNPALAASYSYLPKNTPNIYFFSARDGNEIGAPNCATDLVETELGEMICAYYGNEDDYLLPPLETFSGGLSFTKEFNDLRWRTDLQLSRTESIAFSTPAPINQTDDREGPWVQETALDVFDDATRNALLDNMYIDPFDSHLGRELFGFRYDARFAQPRTVEVETNAFRLVSVLSGSLENWDWETGIVISESESEQTATQGIYNRYEYFAAISGELCSNGVIASLDSNGDPACASGSLLQAYNPFLQNDPQNDAILALTQEQPTRDGESKLYSLDVNLSGELMDFGTDAIRAAFGAEIRREEISDVPSLNSRARFDNGYLVDVFGFGSSLAEADRTQMGAYAELFIPVTEQLDVQVAGRFDHYDDFGSTFNPKVSFAYSPIDELVVRASWSTSFRAPSLTQAGVQLRTTRADFDCGANSDIARLYCEGDNLIRGNNVLELGNPLLEAEESEAYSVGFAYSPAQNTTITVDYWAFDHEDLVDTNMTDVLVNAISDASLRHCGLVPEGAQGISFDPQLCEPVFNEETGELEDITDLQGRFIDEEGANLFEILDDWVATAQPRIEDIPLFRDHVISLDNTGSQELEGIDFRFDHVFEFEGGDLEIGLSGTHYLTYERNIVGSQAVEELAGTFRFPETFANAQIFWVTDDWYAGAFVFFTDGYDDDIDRLRGREVDEVAAMGLLDENEQRSVSSWTTVRLSAGYSFENADIDFVVENLFDREAPLAFGSARGFDSVNHDPFGTRYRLSFRYYFE